MNASQILAVMITAALCCSCSLNLANGMLAYDSKETRLGFARTSAVNPDGSRESSIIFDTKGAVGDAPQISVRELVLDQLKSGKTVNQIATALGVDVEFIRELLD